MDEIDFATAFAALTGNAPFPWQGALYREFRERVFRSCNLPTGLGKTAVIPIWLIALANTAKVVPRRLVYIVNRRTVVDQATREAEKIRDKMVGRFGPPPEVLCRLAERLAMLAADPTAGPLAISTLRGQFADNGEWWKDPARPAVVVGTIDMIGSRLLFSGYGAGFKYRPLYAGFLGQDTLIVHDEAHLEPAFQTLLTAISDEQARRHDFRPLRMLALTATSREANGTPLFELTDDDRNHPVVNQRLTALKGVAFHTVGSEKGAVASRIARLAAEYKDSGKAVLVFVRTLDDVTAVRKEVEKTKKPVQLLTGTVRGWERDRMAREDPTFGRFLHNPQVPPVEGTVYLICTSAGEVGVDISADHLVCDLTPFDSMAQRFGRVNRRGNGDAQIDVVYEAEPDPKNADSEFEMARRATLTLLQRLPHREDGRHDASPQALGDLPAGDRSAAFSPAPRLLPVDDMLFDAWALTTIRDAMPGRPPITGWLHGVEENTPPETYVAWREEVTLLEYSGLTEKDLADLLDNYPLKPHELLRDRTDRVFRHLQSLGEAAPHLPVWLLSPTGQLEVLRLGILVHDYQQQLLNRTVVLPPAAGGLTTDGTLCNTPDQVGGVQYDVADELSDEKGYFRRRTTTEGEDDAPPEGMRRVKVVPLRSPGNEDEDTNETGESGEPAGGDKVRLFFTRVQSADDDGSSTARRSQKLASHLEQTEKMAAAIARGVGLDPSLTRVLTLAARWHDLGKRRRVWQQSIGNNRYPTEVLAKSGRRGPLRDLTSYRHEFGSLLDVTRAPDFPGLTDDEKDLILHLIAAHHGRGRPHFPGGEGFDTEAAEATCEQAVQEVPRRFGRLQWKYGRWGLAWLESLLRAADAHASAHPKEDGP